MPTDMDVTDYLAQGGRLTNPHNVPSRYRAELMKLMATFVDSELAGAAGFADVINAGPGIKERIAAAKIVLEKTSNAETILKLMGQFGANTDRYATHHPWADRLPRDTAPGTRRSAHDMRLSVLNYPLDGWTDAVVMNLCVGLGVGVQLDEMTTVSYQPLADAIRDIAPVEGHHVTLATEGLRKLIEAGAHDDIKASLAYWTPRVDAMFGDVEDARMQQLRAWGLRHQTGTQMRDAWQAKRAEALAALGL